MLLNTQAPGFLDREIYQLVSYVYTRFNLCVVLSAPTNVRATVLTSRSVKVTWDQSSSSGITNYLISYTTTASYTGGGSGTINGGSITSGTLTNLEEDVLYTITVQAIGNNNNRLSVNSNEYQ